MKLSKLYSSEIKRFTALLMILMITFSTTAILVVKGQQTVVTVQTDATSYTLGELVTVTGMVRSNGNPVAGEPVGIMVLGPNEEVIWVDQVTTDESGQYLSSFRLPHTAPTGTYNVSVSSANVFNSTTFQVTAGTYSITVDTDRDAYVAGEMVTVNGYVYIDSVGVPGVSVGIMVLDPQNRTVWVDQVSTDAQGRYESSFRLQDGAATGTYNVTVASLGAYAETTFNVVEPTRVNVTIYVYNTATGDPIPNASVTLWDHFTAQWLNGTTTNSTGVAVMETWGHIRFDVVVYKTGYGTVVEGRQQGYLVSDNSGQGYLGEQYLSFGLTTVGVGILEGYITQATDNTPLENAEVSILFKHNGKQYWANSTRTDSSGHYFIGVNVGEWKVWVDRKIWIDEIQDWSLTHMGTYFEIVVSAGGSLTKSIGLWPRGLVTLNSLTVSDEGSVTSFYVLLVNDTYGGMLFVDELLVTELPINVTIPAIQGWLVVIAPPPAFMVYSYYLNWSDTDPSNPVKVNVTLTRFEHLIWSYPSDAENDRLPGRMTVVVHVESYEMIGGEPAPTGPVDPAEGSSVVVYTMIDRGYGTPTIWNSYGVAIRTGVGAFYRTLELGEAEPGYYPCMVAVRNATGHFIDVGYFYYNIFPYQLQCIGAKGKYQPSEHVVFKFLVYGSQGYIDDANVLYTVYDGQWRFVTGGYASRGTETFGIHSRTVTAYTVNITAGTLDVGYYHLIVDVENGKERSFDFWIIDHPTVAFKGHVMNYTILDLFSPEHGSYVIMANATGHFDTRLPAGTYSAWFHFDDKATPGIDARDNSMTLTLDSDVYFPIGFPEYEWRPVVPAFEVNGTVFHDVDGDGIRDPGEPVIPGVSIRAQSSRGVEVEWRMSEPDGSFAMLLATGDIYRIIAGIGTYWQRTVPEVGSGLSAGDLISIDVPLERLASGIITGYVMLDNGTLLTTAQLHFMDRFWTWLGSASTNSTGGYYFEAPADTTLNIWVDPGVPGVMGKPITDVTVGVNATLVLNITLYRSCRVTGQANTQVQILLLDENLTRVWWDMWSDYDGSFDLEVPVNVRYILLWAWNYVPANVTVDLSAGGTVDLGTITLTECSDQVDINIHPRGWEWTWMVGETVDFITELYEVTTWEPLQNAYIKFWVWYWDNGTLIRQGFLNETTPGVYEGNFTAPYSGHYRVIVNASIPALGNVWYTASDFWVSASDKRLYLINASGDYALSDVQAGGAAIYVTLNSTTTGSGVENYPVWFEVRSFDPDTWYMETVYPRTAAEDLGGGLYKVTIPSTLSAGSYTVDIYAGEWETSTQAFFRIVETPLDRAGIYGWVTRSPEPVRGAIVEAWVEGLPYLYVTRTDPSGFYNLSVPVMQAYHVHVYFDNATTSGLDYTSIPEWRRVEVRLLNVLNNVTLARTELVELVIVDQNDNPVPADVLVWDRTSTPVRLVMWAYTWKGPGLFSEKLKEGLYTFEIRPIESWSFGYFFKPATAISADPPTPDRFEVTMPYTDLWSDWQIISVWGDVDPWRAKPGESITISIPLSMLQGLADDPADYLANHTTNFLEVFRWVPGTMPEGYMFNITSWELVQGEEGSEDTLRTTFNIPSNFDAGDYGIRIYFIDEAQKILVSAEMGFLIAEVDIGFAVVPWTVERGGNVMAAVLILGDQGPVTGADVAIEVYNETWSLVSVIPASEVAAGIYAANYTVPANYGAGWWTMKAIVTIEGREAVAYQGFYVSGGEGEGYPL